MTINRCLTIPLISSKFITDSFIYHQYRYSRIYLVFFFMLYSRSYKMIIECPNCRSTRIATKNVGKKTGSVIGAVGGVSSSLSGAEIGASIGAIGGPAGVMLGGLFGALIGGAAGSIAGAKLGEAVDDHVLDNYRCLSCDYEFSQRAD
jgi:DNA-directed RNA polymerase subunit RPC12/RpoP